MSAQVSQKVYTELEDLAKKHGRFDTFAQDLARIAEVVWHNARGKGVQGTEVDAEVGTEPADDESAPVSDESAPVSDESKDSNPAPETTNTEASAQPAG
jgi:hypothetical protein